MPSCEMNLSKCQKKIMRDGSNCDFTFGITFKFKNNKGTKIVRELHWQSFVFVTQIRQIGLRARLNHNRKSYSPFSILYLLFVFFHSKAAGSEYVSVIKFSYLLENKI